MIGSATTTRTRTLVARSVDVVGHPATEAARLPPAQRLRWSRLQRAQDRWDFLAARVAAARLVGQLAGVDPVTVRFEQRCGRCGGAHGRPRTTWPPGWHVSWSHAAGWVAAAVSDRPCGIDAEPVTDQLVITSVLGPEEARELSVIEAGPERTSAFTRLWVRKEALAKAAGLGLAQLEPNRLDCCADVVQLGGSSWQLRDVPTPPQVRVAVAMRLVR